MELNLGIGIDNIIFGITQAELVQLIGEPSKIDLDNDGLPLLQYNKLKCTFWMNSDDKLHWIQCSNPSLKIQQSNVIGQGINDVISKLNLIIKSPYEFDDYGSMESYSFPDTELEIQSEYGIVKTVCFGHFWSGDEPVYPHA